MRAGDLGALEQTQPGLTAGCTHHRGQQSSSAIACSASTAYSMLLLQWQRLVLMLLLQRHTEMLWRAIGPCWLAAGGHILAAAAISQFKIFIEMVR